MVWEEGNTTWIAMSAERVDLGAGGIVHIDACLL